MDKKILIERNKSVSPLMYTEAIQTEGGPKRLGHLAGIGADLNNATRNGRKYPLELWQKVMESDDFKEGMETHTLFAENDHPSEESGRIDTSIKEVAAVLTNMEIREDEGIVFVEFDILDTPQGRITKSLVDYGCVLGVSSRGLGEEIVKDGETIIDPETYSFYGFDIVVQPAVKAARPTATESLNKKARSVVESFKKEIENAKSSDEIESIRRIAECSKLPNMEVINEAIEAKLNSGANNEDNIYVKKLESKITELTDELSKVKSMLKRVSESAVANNIRMKDMQADIKTKDNEIKNVCEQLNKKEDEMRQLKKFTLESSLNVAEKIDENKSKDVKLEKALNSTKKVEEKLSMSIKENETLKKELESLKLEMRNTKRELEKNIKESVDKSRIISDLKENRDNVNENLRNINEKLSIRNDNLSNALKQTESELRRTKENLDKANNQLKENSLQAKKISQQNRLNENKIKTEADKKLAENNKKFSEALSEVIEKYLVNKCAVEGIEEKFLKSNLPKNYTIEDIDKKVSEIVERRRKFNDFPIALGAIKTGTVNLSESLNVSQEDLQTLKLLTGFQK